MRGVLRTRACDLFGVRYPIVQTGMGWVSGPELKAATANAGGLGILAAGVMEMDELRAALASLLGAGAAGGHAGAVGNARHVDALTRAREALVRASAIAARGEPGEIVALELREGLAAIGEVTGRAVGEDLLDRIFSRFCIGK